MKQISLILLIALPFLIQAQDISGGVRIGLNFNNFSGPSELDNAGNELETYEGNSGFLVGGMINVGFTDLVGLRAELLFSQKGGRRKYEGASAIYFNPDSPDEVLALGNRDYVIRVANAYIDIPVTLYFKPTEKLKLFAGANVGFLVRSVGFGELMFNGNAVVGQVPISYTSTLNHNYFKDEGYNSTEVTQSTDFIVNGKDIKIPNESNGYELDFAERTARTYNGIDVGVIGGVSYQLNGTLFLSIMYNLGLLDITNDELDVSYNEANINQRLFNADQDKNRSLQISIGFEF